MGREGEGREGEGRERKGREGKEGKGRFHLVTSSTKIHVDMCRSEYNFLRFHLVTSSTKIHHPSIGMH